MKLVKNVVGSVGGKGGRKIIKEQKCVTGRRHADRGNAF